MCPPPWRHDHPGPGWAPGLARKRRFWFRRFAGLFAGLFLILLLASTFIGYLFSRFSRPGPPHIGFLFFLIIPVVIGIFLVVGFLGRWAFRNIGSPLADVMAAADAVSSGDLQVRLQENMPGELGRLAQSFNRMTTELERAEQQRRNLTADVAHELRTPLHVIQGNLEGILDGVYEPTPEQISSTLEETRLLARLVDDLQTLSLAEAGQLPLHPVECSVSDLLADTATSFSGQSASQGVDLEVDLPVEAQNLDVFADPDRLAQVLGNLVSNALRYTPQGGKITLGAQPIPEGVRLRVTDTGSGIPPGDLPYIFDRFWRADRSRARTAGAGSGLGLAIAKQIVRAHGGTITAESKPGQGTTFLIDLKTSSF